MRLRLMYLFVFKLLLYYVLIICVVTRVYIVFAILHVFVTFNHNMLVLIVFYGTVIVIRVHIVDMCMH